LRWEWPLEIQGLRFPKNGKAAAIEEYSAVQLFLQIARKSHPGFSLLEEERPFVVSICQSLEGVPLAIELAAAWVESFSCQEIALEIERNLGLLTTSLRDAPERQRSLRAAFDHSWNLLSEEERRVFRKLSVFRGGFQRKAAERVAGASLSFLSALMHKSFLRRNAIGRYEVLEVLRQYAEKKLEQVLQERDEARNLHCEHYAEFLHQREERLIGAKQKEALEEIGKEIENVRAGWRWAVAHRKEKIIDKSLESLYLFYEWCSWIQEGEKAFGKAIEALREIDGVMGESGRKRDVILGKALARRGWFCQDLSRFEEAKDLLQQSLSIFHQPDVRREMAFPLKALGVVALKQGKYVEAKQLIQESLTIYEENGDQRGMASCLNNLGAIAPNLTVSTVGKYTEAKQLFQKSLVIFKELGDLWGIAGCLNNLGIIATMLEEYAEAKQLIQESLVIYKELGDRRGIATRTSSLGFVAEMLGEYDKAKQLHQEGIAIFEEIGDRWGIAYSLNNLGFAFCGVEEYQEARKCFHEALKRAIDEQVAPAILYALVGMAALLTNEGKKKQALELITHVLHHPATSHFETKNRAEQLLAELESQLSPQEFAAAQERGKARELEYYVRVYGPGG
jgi:tetratricopeptide (TPR) repeat protein